MARLPFNRTPSATLISRCQPRVSAVRLDLISITNPFSRFPVLHFGAAISNLTFSAYALPLHDPDTGLRPALGMTQPNPFTITFLRSLRLWLYRHAYPIGSTLCNPYHIISYLICSTTVRQSYYNAIQD